MSNQLDRINELFTKIFITPGESVLRTKEALNF